MEWISMSSLANDAMISTFSDQIKWSLILSLYLYLLLFLNKNAHQAIHTRDLLASVEMPL